MPSSGGTWIFDVIQLCVGFGFGVWTVRARFQRLANEGVRDAVFDSTWIKAATAKVQQELDGKQELYRAEKQACLELHESRNHLLDKVATLTQLYGSMKAECQEQRKEKQVVYQDLAIAEDKHDQLCMQLVDKCNQMKLDYEADNPPKTKLWVRTWEAHEVPDTIMVDGAVHTIEGLTGTELCGRVMCVGYKDNSVSNTL